MAFALQQAEGGISVAEICRKVGSVRRPNQLEEEV
ncbi:hypothetical protein HCN58_31160 [Bradyrhizobium sp. WSM 1791]|uniref:Transposase n=1 Tax=Bradyrhizobium australiense TaxID=2721161 RepID=A0A7Y4GXV3_9BRAD|nr:hypothetical protein [Bradyrhizobium australiense]